MADHSYFSDDISALWGPGNQGGLEPAPLPRRVEPEDQPDRDHRLDALERALRDLQESLGARDAAGLDALRTELDVELARQRLDIAAAIEAGLAGIEARLGPRLDALAADIGAVESGLAGTETRLGPRLEALATDTDAIEARLVGIEARLGAQVEALGKEIDAIEAALTAPPHHSGPADAETREELARLAAAIKAHEAEPSGSHRAWEVRHEIEADLDRQLAQLRAESRAITDASLAEVEARLAGRLDGLARQMSALARPVPPSTVFPTPTSEPTPPATNAFPTHPEPTAAPPADPGPQTNGVETVERVGTPIV